MIRLQRFLRLVLLATGFASFAAVGALTQLTANKGEVSDLLTVNNTDVFAATQGGGIYKSVNAGASWARLGGLPTRVRYVNKLAGNDGQVSGSAVVYAATSVGAFKTTNGGTTWTTVYGNAAQTVAVDPATSNNVLLGVKGIGILRSIDGGASWTVASGYDSTDINSIVYQSTTVVWAGFDSIATANWGGVFKSTDGGVTWVVPAQSHPANKYVKVVAVDNVGNVYAGTYNPNNGTGGVYKSATGTGAWGLMATAPFAATGGAPYNLSGIQALHADKGVAGRMWAGSGPFGYAFWRLDAAGWVYGNQDQDKFSIVNALATFSGAPNRLLIAVRGMGVYVSTNANTVTYPGLTLAISNTGLAADRVNALAIPSSGPSTIYMGLTGAAVQRSTNSGVSWTTLLPGFEVIVDAGGTAGGGATLTGYEQIFTVKALSASPTTASNIYAGVQARGIYQLNNVTGASWAPVNSPGLDNSPTKPVPANIRPRGLFVEADNSVYYGFFEKPDLTPGTADDNAGFYRFNGASWSRVLAGPWPGNSGAGKFFKAGTGYYALVNEDLPYRSSDGINFTVYTPAAIPHIGFARLYFTHLAVNPVAPATLVASTNKGFFRSTDNGTSWSFVPTVAAFSTTNYSAVAYSSTGTLFVGTLDGQIFCSTDNGATYSVKTLPGGWAYSAITDIVRNGTTLYFLTDGNGAWQESPPSCP